MIKKLLSGALALMALVACSKEQDAPVVDTPKTKTVRIQLSAGRDEESARALFGIKGDGSGATTGLEMPEKDVLLRIAVKQGTGTPVYQTIQFKKTPGRNHATYTGDITVPVSGSGDYKIAAVHLSDVGGSTYATIGGPNDSYVIYNYSINTLHRQSDLNKLDIMMAYASQWQDLAVTASNTAASVALKLEPIGSLLRVRIKNDTNDAQTFYGMRLGSNALGYGGFFSFEEVFEKGPLFKPNNRAYADFTFSGGIEVAPNSYSDWGYMWVFPRNGLVYQPYTTVALRTTPLTTLRKFENVFTTGVEMVKGSVALTVVYRGGEHDATFGNLPEAVSELGQEVGVPKLSLEYMADSPLNQAGTGFVTQYDQIGYFSSVEANRFSTPILIEGKKYSMPTVDEAKSILPNVYNKDYLGNPIPDEAKDILETSIKIGNVTQDYRADYFGTGGVYYGVRFKNSTNYNRTAFRYRKELESGIAYMVIEATYLGTGIDDITTISNSAYWTRQELANKVIKRKIILAGDMPLSRVDGTQTLQNHGTRFHVWLRESLDVSTRYSLSFLGNQGYVAVTPTHDKIGIIPFIRE